MKTHKTILFSAVIALFFAASFEASADARTKPARKKAPKTSRAASRPAPTEAPVAPRASEPQDQEVGTIKQQYWSGAEEQSVGVVQNRIYSKSGKFEIGGFGGVLLTDPFLSVTSLGGTIGYHFSEFWGLRLLGWKSFSGASSAYETFEATRGAIPLVNEPKSFYGGELALSLIYGKLSMLGKSIVYYDMHLLGGAGITATDTGNYLTPFAGIGQQVYLGQSVALSLDYRLMAYREDLRETVILATLGQVVRTRTNWTNSVTLGLTFLLGSNE